MKLDRHLHKGVMIAFAMLNLGCNNKTEAGTVKLTNTTPSATEINVISSPTARPYCRKCLESRQQRCERESTTILVPADGFQGGEYFSVVDVSNGIFGGQCDNLSVFKNYEISFTETTLGTRCECKAL